MYYYTWFSKLLKYNNNFRGITRQNYNMIKRNAAVADSGLKAPGVLAFGPHRNLATTAGDRTRVLEPRSATFHM